MKTVTSSRRQIVMAVLLGLATLGGAMRYWAPEPSVTRDVGTLLLVLWLPAVGNLVGFAIRKLPSRKSGLQADPGLGPFMPNLFVQLTPLRQERAGNTTLPAGTRRCTVVIGSVGFTATTEAALDEILARIEPALEVPLEMLKPDLALPRLAPGTRFLLLVGNAAVAEGAVVRRLAPSNQ